MRERGISLVESLISLSLFSLLIFSSLQFFGFARRSFFKLKEAQESRVAALSAFEKMKIDLLKGGLGIQIPIKLGLLEGIRDDGTTLTILSREKDFHLTDSVVPGQRKIPLDSTRGIKKEREICIFDSKKGEVVQVISLNEKSIVLSTPLDHSFLKENSQVLLIKKISLFFDEKKQILRRKVNNSPSQPLLEEVLSFDFSCTEDSNTVHLSLSLISKKEKKHEISVFPKNIALACRR